MRQRAFIHLIWAALAALFISGCATSELPKPKDTVETATRAAILATVQADAAERVATQLLDAHLIDSKTAEKVYKAAPEVRAASSGVHLALGQGAAPNTALQALSAAKTSLGIIQAFLANRE